MTDHLLDRPLGDLTLRELTHLGKVAAAVSAALDTLAAPEAPVIEAPRIPAKIHPTVADGIKAVVARKALPKVPQQEGATGADRLAATLAARTSPGNGGAPRPPRTKAEVDQAIAETRTQVSTEVAVDATGKTYQRGPGPGRKICPACHEVTGAACKSCMCGHHFVKAAS